MREFIASSNEKIIILSYTFCLRGIQNRSLVYRFFLQIYCWLPWRHSDSFYSVVSKSFGEFAACKIEATFTVLLEAKSRSGRCPVEDSVALVPLKIQNCNRSIHGILEIVLQSSQEEIGQIKFPNASSQRLEAFYFSLCRLASVIRFHFTFF